MITRQMVGPICTFCRVFFFAAHVPTPPAPAIALILT